MNKLTRAASMLLAAITIIGSTVATASAADIFKFGPGGKDYNKCDICDSLILSYEDYFRYNGKYYHTVCKAEEDNVTLKPTYEYVTTYVPASEGGSIYKESGKVLVGTYPVVTVKPGIICKPGFGVKPGCSTIVGGKYFSSADAKEYLAKYFEKNTYEINIKEGETKSFQTDSYFISSNPEVAYYDYKTGKIVGNNYGAADLYVCTSGGIPYFCLRVNVASSYKTDKKETAYLNVEAEDWQLSVGDKTQLTVTASNGKVYDDIHFAIDFGSENGTVGVKTGTFRADSNGPVVVRAYSKSNPKVHGEALIFVGNYKNYIYDGGWTITGNGISVNHWGCADVVVDYYSYIAGWILSEEDGLLIPIVKKLEAVNLEGDKTTILTGSVLDYTELLKAMYGNKYDLITIIKMYNLYKNGFCKDMITIHDIDYTKIFLGQIFKAING